MSWLSLGDNRFRIADNEFSAWREHAAANQIESGARNQPRHDSAGARFAHRIRGHDGVGKFFILHGWRKHLACESNNTQARLVRHCAPLAAAPGTMSIL